MEVVEITWSGVLEPNDQVRYTHCQGNCPLGDILITWKGWKEYPSYDVDHSPWDSYYGCSSLEEAKQYCQETFETLINRCLL